MASSRRRSDSYCSCSRSNRVCSSDKTASFDSTALSAVHAVLRFACSGATLASRGVALDESRLNRCFDAGEPVAFLGERAHLTKLGEALAGRLQQAFEQLDLSGLAPLRDLGIFLRDDRGVVGAREQEAEHAALDGLRR